MISMILVEIVGTLKKVHKTTANQLQLLNLGKFNTAFQCVQSNSLICYQDLQLSSVLGNLKFGTIKSTFLKLHYIILVIYFIL
jgi:hypothetical protein